MRLLAVTTLIVLALGGVAYARQCDRRVPAAQTGPPSIVIVMDASKSMAKPAGDGRTRLDAAKAALRRLVDGLPEHARVGLRLYGHRVSGTTRAQGCRDTELVAPVDGLDRRQLRAQIDSYRAVGSTPIGRALSEAAGDVGTSGRSSIVLVSDGGDNCAPPRPCDVAARIADQGTDVNIQAVGFQVQQRARDELRCIARRGGGAYRDAADAEELAVVLRALAARATRTFEVTGAPIRGGQSAAAAAPISSGRFVDEIGPGEERWYSLRLARGQRVAASAALVMACPIGGEGDSGQSFKGALAGTVQLRIRGPGDVPQPSAADFAIGLFVTDIPVESTGVLTPVVDPARDAAEDFDRPGTYRMRVTVNGVADSAGFSTLPLELAVNVISDVPRANGDGDAGAGADGMSLLVVLIGGAVVGALGAAAVGAIRRTRT